MRKTRRSRMRHKSKFVVSSRPNAGRGGDRRWGPSSRLGRAGAWETSFFKIYCTDSKRQTGAYGQRPAQTSFVQRVPCFQNKNATCETCTQRSGGCMLNCKVLAFLGKSEDPVTPIHHLNSIQSTEYPFLFDIFLRELTSITS